MSDSQPLLRSVCSAKMPSGRSEAVFVMESAENRIGADGIALTTAVPCGGFREGDSRRIRNSRSQGHMRSSAVVVPGPGFEQGTQMRLRERNHPVQALSA